MGDRERFSRLPELKKDDQIIDMILSALIHCRESAGYPFEMHRDKFSVEDVCRIVGIMQSKGLVSVASDEFGDKYDDKLTIEPKGSLIAGLGGWIAYLNSQKTEADWIDDVLRDAKKANISLCRETPDEYQHAVEQARIKYKLITEVTTNSYSLTEEGECALELGGFIEWQKDRKLKKDNESRPSSIVGNNNIIGNGNSGNAQGSTFRDLNNTHNVTTAIPATNDHKQKATTSLIGTWIAPVVTTIAAAIIISLIAYYFPQLSKILGGK